MTDTARSVKDGIVLPPHGGDLTWARETFGDPADGWLDLSTGLNPWPYPVHNPNSADWAHLPTKDDEQALLSAAARFYKVMDDAGLVAAPGTQALIQWLPRIVPPSGVAIVAPTYAEHAKAWFRAGHEVVEVSSLAEVPAMVEIVVVVNPNNPDGRWTAKEELLALSRPLAERGGFVLVDEAFADLAPERSLAPEAGRPGLVVLKSFGKFFGLAGLRLGFALGPSSMQKALVECLGPWAVSAPALTIGAQALNDNVWADETRRRLNKARAELDAVLSDAGLVVAGGTDLFRLIDTSAAEALFVHLGRNGILVRSFAYNPNWLRIGLPGSAEKRQHLAKVLKTFSG